jgi:hypothetical protein
LDRSVSSISFVAVLVPKLLNLTLVLESLTFLGSLILSLLEFGPEPESSGLRPVLSGELVSRLDLPNMPPMAWNWRSAGIFSLKKRITIIHFGKSMILDIQIRQRQPIDALGPEAAPSLGLQ